MGVEGALRELVISLNASRNAASQPSARFFPMLANASLRDRDPPTGISRQALFEAFRVRNDPLVFRCGSELLRGRCETSSILAPNLSRQILICPSCFEDNSLPKYLLIVLAFAGDSTITKFLAII